MDTYLCILVLILIILIIVSGFFSASETALTAFRSLHLEKLENDHKDKEVNLLKKWLKNPTDMLTGILLGNNVVNILASSIATVVTMQIVGGNTSRTVFIATVIMTIVVLIFGEITPKIIAKNYTLKISVGVIRIIYIFSMITKPLIKIFVFISKFLGKLFGINIKDDRLLITSEDIISFVNVGEAEGVIEEDEKEMIHSIVGFAEITAKEVMTPRTAVLAFESSRTINDVWEELMDNGFSRIPVYEKTIDDIVGVLYIKDIMNAVKDGKTDLPLKDFARPAYFIPETKSIIEILNEFRKLQVHIAMVLDEYGGIVGIVTIEDLIEEIVGEIRDEYDTEEEESIERIDDTEFEVDGMIDIETLDKELNIKLPESEEYESLGGLVVKELGKVASVGDEVVINNVNLKVLELDKLRVSKVLIKKLPQKEDGDTEEKTNEKDENKKEEK